MNSIRGYRLISKAGKSSYDRFKILREKDDILQTSKRKRRVIRKKASKKQLIVDLLRASELREVEEQARIETIAEEEHGTRSSRLEFNHTESPHYNNSKEITQFSSCDFYTPSYKAQDKHIPTIKFFHSPTGTRKRPEMRMAINAASLNSSPKSRSITHLPSCIPFKKQLPRNDVLIYKHLSEKRFNYTPVPSTLTCVPDFNKQISRPLFYKLPDCFPDYNPKKEVVLKKISHNIIFDKFLQRQAIKRKEFVPDAYDINYASIDPKAKYFKF